MPKGIPKAGHRKPGAGKLKGEPTTTIAFRVPVQHQDRIKVMVKNYLKDLKSDPVNNICDGGKWIGYAFVKNN
jgi:hypothetical protein